MSQAVAALLTVERLRDYVRRTLCARDRLEPDTTPFFQGLITRAGRPCGLFFMVQGPRMLRTYAVWAGEEDRILFYDSTGLRFGETRLSEGNPLAELIRGDDGKRKKAA
jgi:hypothetical protein